MKGLAGKRVVVTGGASGIGAAIVERFLEEGSRVAVLDRDARPLFEEPRDDRRADPARAARDEDALPGKTFHQGINPRCRRHPRRAPRPS